MNIRPGFAERVSAAELQRRQDAVRAGMARAGVDALLISGDGPYFKLGHLRYLTNWCQPLFNEYFLFPMQGDPLFISRYSGRKKLLATSMSVAARNPEYGVGLQAANPIPSIRTGGIPPAFVADGVKEAGVKRLGLCGPETMSGDFYVALLAELRSRDIHSETMSELLEDLRVIKSPEEQNWVRQSAINGSYGYEVFKGIVAPGRREYEVWAQVDLAQQLAGAECIFRTSARGKSPVSKFMDMACDVFELGDTVLFNSETAGPGGYYTQVVRTVVLGRADAEVAQAHAVNVAAQHAGAEKLVPGNRMTDVYEAITAAAKLQGYDASVTHLGHGQGLDILEPPLVSRFDETVIRPGMIITLHPSVATPSGRSVRSGDTYLVHETGAEMLSTASTDLVEID